MHWNMGDPLYGVLLGFGSVAGVATLAWSACGGLFCWVVVVVVVEGLAGILGVVPSVDVIAPDSVVPLCMGGRGGNDRFITFEVSAAVVPELLP